MHQRSSRLSGLLPVTRLDLKSVNILEMQRRCVWSLPHCSCSQSVLEIETRDKKRSDQWFVLIMPESLLHYNPATWLIHSFIPQSFKDAECEEQLARGQNRRALSWIEREDKQKNVIHPLLQKERPSCFVEQKLIWAEEGSEAQEGPIDCTINIQTGGSA